MNWTLENCAPSGRPQKWVKNVIQTKHCSNQVKLIKTIPIWSVGTIALTFNQIYGRYGHKSTILGPKMGPKYYFAVITSEMLPNRGKPYMNRFLRSIMTIGTIFIMILNWYSGRTPNPQCFVVLMSLLCLW